MIKLFSCWAFVFITCFSTVHLATADVLPIPEPAFKGRIGISAKDSKPDWPKPVTAPKGAPNIVLIMLDDIGFGDTSTFGGPAQTPALDKLAAEGLRYNTFHTTSICSPTRAALLSGRNHHRVGFGDITQTASGYPGYNAFWKKNSASIAEILYQNGYRTTAFGKWHNVPSKESKPSGPYERWPTGLGFEYFYGFMGGQVSQWEPTGLYRNTTPVDPPATAAQGYHLTTDLTDDAIRWLNTHESLSPDQPYLLYFAPGAVHEPHHAPKQWIDRYRGKFDRGWDKIREEIFARQKKLGVIPASTKLTQRPKAIPAWDSLSSDQKKLYARQMEVYAGFVAHTDAEVGRLLEKVRSGPDADNTLIIYIVGDNGAAGQMGLDGGFVGKLTTVQEQLQHIDDLGSEKVARNFYSAGWAWVGSTPFQGWKRIASHLGGTRNPLIISWPAHIKDKGGLRSQFTYVTDVAATIYDVTGIPFPSSVNGTPQQPLDGVSFAHTFNNVDAISHHYVQYFEVRGYRAIYKDGWVAAARHRTPWDWWDKNEKNDNYQDDRWELYHVATDFSQAHDVAAQYPEKLKALRTLFHQEASRNNVYPLGASFQR